MADLPPFDGHPVKGGRVYVTRPIPAAGIEVLAATGATVIVWSGRGETPERSELARALGQTDVVVALLTERIDAAMLEAAPDLAGIANQAAGHDNIDLDAATALGIPVSNTPDVLTDTTADLTWALILAAARRLVEADTFMRRGRYRLWGPELMLGEDISPGGDGRRKTLGIVGFGRIGAAVARRAAGFDMEVIAYHPHHPERVCRSGLARPVDLATLLQHSDIVSLHVPLTTATRHLIGAPELAAMKPTAVLINTSRGPVVDEAALVDALRQGRIAAAGLDVYEHEPAMAPLLAEQPNTVLLPHIASGSRATRVAMATMAAHDAVAMLKGDPAPHGLNPEVYAGDAYAERKSRLAARLARLNHE